MIELFNTEHAQLDVTTANAVQSLFGGPVDPWAKTVVPDFVDFFVWNDKITYPVAHRENRQDLNLCAPPVLLDLQRREPESIAVHLIPISETRQLLAEHTGPAWRSFARFCRTNPLAVRAFYKLHTTELVRRQIRSRNPADTHYVFDVASLEHSSEVDRLARLLKLPNEAVLYILDLVLKYLIYSEFSNGGRYLAHPIRARQDYAGLGVEPLNTGPVRIPFRLGPYLTSENRAKNQDWFTSRIHEARAFVREFDLQVYDRTTSREILRELAMRLGLSATIKGYDKAHRFAGSAGAVGSIAGSLVTSSVWPAVAGSAFSLATTIWSGGVPGSLARRSWIRWACDWKIQSESEDK